MTDEKENLNKDDNQTADVTDVTDAADEADAVDADEAADEAYVVENDTAALDEPQDETAALKDQLLRQAAEYDNFRKRTARERLELEPEITSRVVTKFLPVFDNFERALAAETTDPEYKKGIEMIYGGFKKTLDELNVETLPEEGLFDPAFHQAVQQVDSDLASGTITATLQKGYKLGSKILRFAMVAVAK